MKIVILVLVVLAALGLYGYYAQHHDSNGALGSGAITARDGSSTDNPADSETRASTTTDNSPTQGVGSGQSTNQPPYNATAGQTSMPMTAPATTTLAPAVAIPSNDSVAPNPTDGARFIGSGRFQWYRQGDLTWRVDTSTGAACVIFATKPEWRDPDVYRHGCGNA
jgi:hypothetical protein